MRSETRKMVEGKGRKVRRQCQRWKGRLRDRLISVDQREKREKILEGESQESAPRLCYFA
jgi:hypothetical protein